MTIKLTDENLKALKLYFDMIFERELTDEEFEQQVNVEIGLNTGQKLYNLLLAEKNA